MTAWKLRLLRTRVPGALAAFAALTLIGAAGASPASAADEVGCATVSIKARPDVYRSYDLQCTGLDRVAYTTRPAKGEIGFWYGVDGISGVHYTAHAGTSGHDEFEVVLSGDAGSKVLTGDVTINPASVNTPPTCENGGHQSAFRYHRDPIRTFLQGRCHDAEHDAIAFHGAGPGTHENLPVEVRTDETHGKAEWRWTYGTTIGYGTETARYYAVDALGARSADAEYVLDITKVVDDPTLCHPNGGASAPDWVAPILTRPGQAHTFSLSCESHDADTMDVRVVAQPSNGTLEILARHPVGTNYAGKVQQVDFRYTPHSAVAGDDPFTLAVDARSPATDNRFVMRAVPVSQDPGSVSCGTYEPEWAWERETYALKAWCSTSYGDPVTAEVVQAPLHGTTRPVPPGANDPITTVDYVPAPGYVGEDRVTVRYTTEGGATRDHTYVIQVIDRNVVLSPPPGWVPPPWFPTGPGPVATPLSVAASKASARALLRSTDVVEVKRLGAARVYADRKAWRRGLNANQSTALAVICAKECQVETTVRLDVRGVTARGSAMRSISTQRGTAAGGRPLAVKLRLTKADRARARRARSARALFDVQVRDAGGKVRSASLSATLRR